MTDLQATDLEIGTFNWTLRKADELKIPRMWTNARFNQLYLSKARSLIGNVDASAYVGNTRLVERIQEGEFKPHDVASMQPDHVFPERWRNVVEMKVRRDEYICNARPAAMTDQFKCNRCKKRECSYMELQTRSCDEPASLFIQCLACGNRWRMG
jgi:transcription elongation factor S-II